MSFSRKEDSQYQIKYDNIDEINYNGIDYSSKSSKELNTLFSDVLKTGVHGLCFSLYEDGQKPGDIISEEQVLRRMKIIAPYTKWVRSFSCTEGNEFIPMIAKEYGIKTYIDLINMYKVNSPIHTLLLENFDYNMYNVLVVG